MNPPEAQDKKAMSVSAGAATMVAMRWSDRLLGLLSTLVLARLLAPEDFGVIALASVVIELIDVLLDMGVATTLVQNLRATRRDYHAAWTLRLIQFVIGAVLVAACAPLAANYFHDPRIGPVMQVLAVATLISGFENIGIVAFQKNMQFGMDFRFFFYKRVISVAVTLAAAVVLQSYWALVIGTIVLRISGVALSYAMHPMRPRLDFSGIRAILSFSMWNVMRSIGAHLNENADRLIVGRRVSTGMMGQYSMASDIAALPSTELLMPIGRVLLPAFVKEKEDPARLRETFLLALGIQALVGIPAGAGLALVAPELVAAMLGDRWKAAIPFVQIMGVINVATAISASGACLLLAIGRPKVVAINAWLQVLLFLACAVWLIPHEGAVGVALLRLAVAGLGLASFVFLLVRELPALRLMDLVDAVWRPCIGAALMWLALSMLPLPGGMPVVLQLLWKVVLGAGVFIAAILALWLLSGRGDGPESYLLGKVREWLRLKPQGA
ncbi:oligosaccharide flippase family protein [Lacisediminimonas profundi]|uniref:oligosaccharide flippase family protein n=1 Tax=Lacisediminimonas profundi TaxID=2603856 RepID=UPI0019D611A8|nr:oligosaccharide flippase family protein [Lacisediminimonas profundi]